MRETPDQRPVSRWFDRPGLRGAAAALAVVGVIAGVGTAAAGGRAVRHSANPDPILAVTTTAPDHAAAAVLAAARLHLGQKYVYGGVGPTSWDCSGFTSVLWQTIGGVRSIPRTAAQQQRWATPVPVSQVLPGDLYFLGTPATHVGLVVGGGLVLDASSSSGRVVLRSLWTATGVTFGRVRRTTAVPVTGAPVPTAPAPTTAPAPAPTTAPPAPVTTVPVPTAPVTTAPVPTTPPAAVAAPFVPADRSLVAAARALLGAKYAAGAAGPAYDDGALVAAAWHTAGGGVLPLDRNTLAARTKPVNPAHLELGDLVIYGGVNAVWHVGLYVGHGLMIDSSRANGHVVLRPLLVSPDRRFGRLH